MLDQVRATALNKGVTIDFATDVGRIEDLELSPSYWARFDGTNAKTAAAYTRANLVGVDIGRSDTQYLKGYSVESALTGLRLRTDRGVTGDISVSSSVQYNDVRMDDVTTGVQLDDVNTIAVQLTHATINATGTGIAAGSGFSQTTFNCADCTLNAPTGAGVAIALTIDKAPKTTGSTPGSPPSRLSRAYRGRTWSSRPCSTCTAERGTRRLLRRSA